MNRTLKLFAVLVFLFSGYNILFSAEKQQPNFLFILADDYGYSDTGISGSHFYETPNIDKIATQGMIFTNGYACCQVCSPSRASIMTGKFPARHGITDWIGAATGEEWRNAGRFNKLLPPEYLHNLPKEFTTPSSRSSTEAAQDRRT